MDLEKVSIQEMDIKDLDEILTIENSSSLTPWSKKMFIKEIQNPITHCYIAKMDNQNKYSVIGYICFRIINDESELHNICVHPLFRKLGMGKKIMQFYIDFCIQIGIKAFYLEVHSSNQPAIHLYQYFSYQSFGTRKKFYQEKFDALLMMKKV
jgi:ribosomal-protein-alanine N-acetyltransferase